MDNVKKKSTLKAKVQKLGTSLSGMIMPNIAAIIAWGLVTALFMPLGWFPNAQIAKLINPMLMYLLPILIGYTGGRLVYEDRGAVIGAIATMGVIAGAKIPMFLGAMIMGPLGGWTIKQFDKLFQDKVKSGFEMIYNNFSSGILGMLLAIVGIYIVEPIVVAGSNYMAMGVDWIISIHMLPLANIFIEPAKVLFLNNAIGNGILVPLGIQQASTAGKSVLFLLESNPGPGLGILLAFTMFGKGSAKGSAPGAIIIEFFGGVHEIYFPYVLMKPALLLAAIAGGVAGTTTFQLLGAGLKAAASPGSILAILLMTPKGAYFGVLMGVLVAAVVSFLVAAPILKSDKNLGDDLEEKQEQVSQMKNESKGNNSVLSEQSATAQVNSFSDVKKIIFACDAGMGSSAMGASLLRDKAKKAGIDISITNTAISRLKDEPGLLVITQSELAERAAQKSPDAMHVSVGNFLSAPEYDLVIAKLRAVSAINEDTDDGIQSSKEAVKKANISKNNIDYAQIKEVNFIRHDQHTGTATMATSLFKDDLKKEHKKTPVKAVRINELVDDNSHLIIASEDAAKNLRTRYSNIQILVVNDLLKDPLLEETAQKLN